MSDLFGTEDEADLEPDQGAGAQISPGTRPRSPLAVRMRPRSLDEVVGQQHLLGSGSPLRLLAAGAGQSGPAGPSSVILWGPPGTGKTTLAHAIARGPGRKFVELSAITAGVKDVRQVMEEALTARDLYRTTTVLFLDEIHRFNKAQQDALLPGVENGWVVLVAATTENPSFSVVSPLLSRSLLLTLEPLTDDDIEGLVARAVADPRGLGGQGPAQRRGAGPPDPAGLRRRPPGPDGAGGRGRGGRTRWHADGAAAKEPVTVELEHAERPSMQPRCATTAPGTSTTTSSAPSSSRSAAPTSTRPCTTWRA